MSMHDLICTQSIYSRLPVLLQATKPSVQHFNIWSVPTKVDLTWIKPTRDSLVEQLALKTETDQPMKLWVVGEVTNDGAWLVGANSAPATRVSMKIRPICVGEDKKWENFLASLGGWKGESNACLYYDLFSRRAGGDSDGVVSASKYMASRLKGETAYTVRHWSFLIYRRALKSV